MTSRPIPGDPGSPIIKEMFSAGPEWIITAEDGSYDSFAAETMLADGSNFQRVIGIEWRGQTNKTHEPATARVMMRPEDAVGLAEALVHTATWLRALAEHEGEV